MRDLTDINTFIEVLNEALGQFIVPTEFHMYSLNESNIDAARETIPEVRERNLKAGDVVRRELTPHTEAWLDRVEDVDGNATPVVHIGHQHQDHEDPLKSVPERVDYEVWLETHDVGVPSIGGTYKVRKTFFVMYGYSITPATRWEPEDVDVFEIGREENLWQAVGMVVTAMLKESLDGWLQSKAECLVPDYDEVEGDPFGSV